MPARMIPCLDHVAIDRARRHAEPPGDPVMGQILDAIEQKVIAAGRRRT
jgi:hypothetical protein